MPTLFRVSPDRGDPVAHRMGNKQGAKAVFSLLEKDGKVEAVVKIDRLKEYNIPVYLELDAHKILVQP